PTARAPPRPRRCTFWRPTRGPAGPSRLCRRRRAGGLARWGRLAGAGGRRVRLARLASLVMVGKTLDELGVNDEVVPSHFSVKESVFPFNKFPGVDIILGPEMRSTGEVMGIDDSFPMAFAKSQLAANAALPTSGQVFISVADRDKPEIVPVARKLSELGYQLIATRGTAKVLRDAGVAVEEVHKLQEGRPNLIDKM